MFVAVAAVCLGVVCLYYGARSLRAGRAIHRLHSRDRAGPSHPTDWTGSAGEDPVESGGTLTERGSLERGVVLLVLGALCLLFGVLAA